MAEATTSETPAELASPTDRVRWRSWLSWHRLALGGILLVAAFLNFFELGANGYGSYYPPAIRSMMDNWHNFFFASYDPGGFVTVDKPPLGFWFDVLSAKIFGFNAVSILLPQALAGVLAVLLLYYLVRRHFGVVAGLLAALILAVTPVSVVTNRDITIDSILALFLLIGAWAVLRAAESGQLRWLLLSALMVGLGFNVKMLEAYLVVPAYAVLYLFAAPGNVWKRLWHLGLAALVLLVVSFAWIEAVDLTPASQRPYVDSTQDDSELSLALGYNGISRLLGMGSPIGGAPISSSSSPQGRSSSGTPPSSTSNPGGGGAPPSPSNSSANAAPAGLFATGNPGPLRLFQEALGSQISWLLPLALLGMLALAWQGRPRVREDLKLHSLVFWGMWLLTMGIFFSVAGFFHPYYMIEMAPGLAALAGIGLVTMWSDYQRAGWRGWLLPVALVATAAEQIYLLHAYPAWSLWMTPLILVLTLLAAAFLLGMRLLRSRFEALRSRLLHLALGIGLAALLLSSIVWSVTPILLSHDPDTLTAGPPTLNGGNAVIGSANGQVFFIAAPLPAGSGPAGGASGTDLSSLVRYLEANQRNTKFLVAVPHSQGITDQLILTTNRPVMSMYGFSNDPILTTSTLANLIKNGTVRFFLLPINGPLPEQILDQLSPQAREAAQQASQDPLSTWITQHCQKVPASRWQSPSANSGAGSLGASQQLYDCTTLH